MLYKIAVAALVIAANGLEVTVYDGPKECDDSEKVKKGQQLSMHYTGTIDQSSATGEKGKQFDSSRTRGSTFDFKIGEGRVIKGWDEGLLGLCKGAKATLVIEPEKGYGASGAGGDIPGGATLNFDVEVVDFSDKEDDGKGGGGGDEPNLFADLDVNKDGKLTKEEVLEFFKKQGKDELPDGLWENEDKDQDGFITWEEFGGPKGDEPPKEEL